MTRKAPTDVTALLKARGQAHLLPAFDALDPQKNARFADELRDVDFDLLEELVAEASAPPKPAREATPEPPEVFCKGADPAKDAAYRKAGEELLAAGKVAALVVAGGQGSRLGHIGPKGTFPATPVRKKSLFRLFSEKLRVLELRHGRPVPLLVMTSEENHADTVAFFEANGRFGLAADQIVFFTQGMMPACDLQGRLVLKEPGTLFRSPNGHGGTLLALHRSGTLDELAKRGIEEIFYFQVDNPLVEICDPVFLGLHRTAGADLSTKVVAKSGPDEKVGVLVKRGGIAGVVEYSDLPAELRNARDASGALRFSAGNIAVHVLRTAFVRRLNARGFSLPYHVARKKLACISPEGAPVEVDGLKFETFVFDALAFAERSCAMEVKREREFAPIKNATGADSAETSTDLQSRLAAERLDLAGVAVPRDAEGRPRVPIEISPLFADSTEELIARRPSVPDFTKPVYLGDP
jgi:UDP-N-acetylglucosamine/UDP-N-acetylgalactosamine diphosphorylase